MKTLHKHAAIIKHFGGPTKLAKLLGFTGRHSGSGSSQSVANWQWRGIPELIRLKHKDVITQELLERLS